ENETGELRQLPIGHARDPVRRFGVEVAAQSLGEGLERSHRILVTTAPQDQRAFDLDGASQFADQARLADARVTFDEKEVALALSDRRPPVVQQGRLTVSSDERTLRR